MRLLAVFGLLLGPPQEDDARRALSLIQQLDSDSPEEREAAEKELLEWGDSAEGFLQTAAREGKAEVRARCKDLLRTIAQDRKRREFWAPAKPITIDYRETPLQEALDRLAKSTGYLLRVGTVNPQARVTLSLQEATFLRALEAICLSLGCWYRWDGASIVLGKAEAGHSRGHAGPLLLSAALGPGAPANPSLDLRLEWDPGLRIRWYEIEIDSALDDKGVSVEEKTPANLAGYVHGLVYSRSHRLPREGDSRCFSSDELSLTGLSPGATRLNSLKGRITLFLPELAQKVRLEKVNAPVVLGGVTATLRELSAGTSRAGWGATIDLDLSRTPTAAHRSLFAHLLNSRILFVRGDHPGIPGENSGASSGGSIDDPLLSVGRSIRTDQFAEGAGPTAVEATIVTEVWQKTFPFELRDVRRPEPVK
jgi:voltage-gated potassium channel Kch